MAIPFTKNKLALTVGLLSGVFLMPAIAEEADTTTQRTVSLEEVIVTAQKREQDMQDTPISIQAFNAEAMQKQNINDINDAAQYMPNVSVVESQGGSTGATIGIRGSIAMNPQISLEPTVGVYVDGVFIAKNVGGLFDVAELERIEVLRGPQGTLYGKNTIGGAVNLVTRKPGEEFGGTVKVKAGNYNYTDAFVSVDTGKFGDVASFNIAVSKRDRDGFYKNTAAASNPGVAKRFKELDSTSARIAGLFDVSDELSLYYTFDMNEKDNTPTFGQYDPFIPGTVGKTNDSRRSQGGLDGTYYDKSQSQGHAFHVTWDMTDILTFKSITAYREMKFKDSTDFDGQSGGYAPLPTPPLYQTTGIMQFHAARKASAEQYSQEFQIIGSTDSVDFVAGLYYFNENTDAENPFDIGFSGFPQQIDNAYGINSESVALFGQADWAVTDGLILTAGIRFNYEEKEAYMQRTDNTSFFGGASMNSTAGKLHAKDDWTNVSPMAAISYMWDNGINTYFKVSQGWKAGGFNGESGADVANGLTAEDVFKQSYKPEKVTSYELGMKARWWDNRIQTNVALFHDRLDDLQVPKFLGAYTAMYNAGKAVRQGVEVDLIMQITHGLSANINYGYLHSSYKTYKQGGIERKDAVRFPFSPKHTGSVGLQYIADLSAGELQMRIDYSGTSNFFVNEDRATGTAEASRVRGHGIVNARVALAEMPVGKNQTLEVGLWGKNLGNTEYRLNGIPVSDVGNPGLGVQPKVVGAVNYYGDPRTFGADVSYKW